MGMTRSGGLCVDERGFNVRYGYLLRHENRTDYGYLTFEFNLLRFFVPRRLVLNREAQA